MKKSLPYNLQSSDSPNLQSSDPGISEGWQGWDSYAPFYDWENARTLGRRDVPFWRRFALAVLADSDSVRNGHALEASPARRAQRACEGAARGEGGPRERPSRGVGRRPAPGGGGRTLELGCGTGRVLAPLARAGVSIVGIDRSAPMLARARRRLRRAQLAGVATLARGDIRALPFTEGAFDLVLAPYGVLQSLTRDADLAAALDAIARVIRPGGAFGLDLVPDLPRWSEYTRRVSLRGTGLRRGTHLTLVESVRQDRRRGLTIFDQEYVERRGRERRTHEFSLVFRTVTVPGMRRRVERAGFRVEAVLGGYDGAPWRADADTWVILATRV